MRRFQFLALLVVSLFTTNLSAQQPGQPGSIPFRPPFPNQGPAKPYTPEAIAEFNVIYDLLQSAFSNPIEESVRQVAAFSKKYPDTAAAYALLGELKYIQFQMAGGCGMSDEVVMLAQKAIMTNQRSAEGYTLAAKAALCNRNAAWYRFADNALAIAPNKPEALYVKARVLEQQGDYKESEVFFRRTLDLMKTPHRKSNIFR